MQTDVLAVKTGVGVLRDVLCIRRAGGRHPSRAGAFFGSDGGVVGTTGAPSRVGGRPEAPGRVTAS